MIICHCNRISVEEIEDVITGFLKEDPWQLIVPLQVYHALEKKGKCCGCLPNVVKIIVKTVETYHQKHNTPKAEIISLVDRINEKHQSCITARRLMRQKRRNVA